MPLEFIDLNSLPVVAVNCDNRKAMGKEKLHRTRLEKSTKNDNMEFKKNIYIHMRINENKEKKSSKICNRYT